VALISLLNDVLECEFWVYTCFPAQRDLKALEVAKIFVIQLHAARSMSTSPKMFLTEAVKRSSKLCCGDLKHTRGEYFIRSTQTCSDDRRAVMSKRTSHALNSFCFANLPDGRYSLARILGIVAMESQPTPCVYCLIVVMTKEKGGFLPYDLYKYSTVSGCSSSSYANIVVINADNIACPAFCVHVNPDRFRAVDNLRSDGDLYYCIPPERVLCRRSTYEEMLTLNTTHFDAFRSVSTMNDLNCDLVARVAAFNVTALEKKDVRAAAATVRRKQQAQQQKDKKRLEGLPQRVCGKNVRTKPKKKISKDSSSEDESSEEVSSSCEERNGKDDNVFGDSSSQ